MSVKIPHPVRFTAGTTPVRHGDTVATILQRFGQPPSAYVELAGANLGTEVVGAPGIVGVPRLSAGQRLNVPASWVPKTQVHNRRNAGHLAGPGGFLADATEDSVKALLGPASGLGLSQSEYADVAAALAGFWRRDQGTALPVSNADIGPYLTTVESFRKNVLSKLPAGIASRIPWSTVPLATLLQWQAAGFPLTLVNWGALNNYLVKQVAPGQFPDTGAPTSWKAVGTSATALAQSGIRPEWWVMLTEPRWDLLPLSKIDPTTYQPGADPTTWLARRVRDLTVDPNAASQDAFPGFPQIPGIDLASCGLGQVKIGDKCLGANAPNMDGTCPQGTLSYKGLCIVSPCAFGETPNVTPTGITCTPGGNGLPATPPGFPGTLPQLPGGGGAVSQGIPGGCPPGATVTNGSCDCSPLGPRFVLDPSFEPGTPACIDCGANAFYNANTKQCSCQPGFVLPTSGDIGAGCVPAPTPANPGEVPVPPKDGTAVVVTKDEPSTFARVATVVGLATGLGALYLGYQNLNKSKRKA